jgi:hypothetical protein
MIIWVQLLVEKFFSEFLKKKSFIKNVSAEEASSSDDRKSRL